MHVAVLRKEQKPRETERRIGLQLPSPPPPRREDSEDTPARSHRGVTTIKPHADDATQEFEISFDIG